MAPLPISELIGRSVALFGVPHYVAKGALDGRTAPMEPSEAQQVIQSWLETPIAGSPQNPMPVPQHVALIALDPLGGEGQVPVVRNGQIVWEDAGAGGGSGGGSLVFNQAQAAVAPSLAVRAAAAAHYMSGTVTVASPVSAHRDLIAVLVNGVTLATLDIVSGDTTKTTVIDVPVVPGDRIAVSRLDIDGGSCLVQLDRVA